MISTILAYFKKLTSIEKILLVVSILLVIGIVILSFSLSSIKHDYVSVGNTLAQTDSLHRLLQVDNQILSVRYAEKVDNLIKLVDSNKILKKYITQKDVKIQSLITKVEQLKIENVTLRGTLSKDSLGNEIATFDTTAEFFAMKAVTQLKPTPKLGILWLSLLDSSQVGISKIDENGLVEGFVTHSNPFITDINANFKTQLSESNGWSLPSIRIPWIWLPVTIGVTGGVVYLLMK
jgi:hypothetical protein